MFVIKTETYKFPNHAEAQAYYDYFVDKYEVGGAEVEKCYRNGMTELSFSYIVDTDQDEDFVKYKIKNYKNTLDK
jgi:hypothetical protein